ncbi:MAG: serine/threonine-protein kinase, partial [Thermoguttaceae bacterium]
DGNVHFMVHEFIDGGDLRSLLLRYTTLPIETVASIFAQVAEALASIHESGFIHRDIKPANILLQSSGVAKLIDLGLAIPYNRDAFAPSFFSSSESNLSDPTFMSDMTTPAKTSGKVAGTVDYLAPDQIRNPNEPSPLWDIYSLGCSMYHALTGRVPFPLGTVQQKCRDRVTNDIDDVRNYNQAIPFDLASLLREMLTRNPRSRIQSAREVARRLEAWIPPSGLLYQVAFGNK